MHYCAEEKADEEDGFLLPNSLDREAFLLTIDRIIKLRSFGGMGGGDEA